MSTDYDLNIQEIIGTIELYLNAEIDELQKQLANLRKINKEYVSEELCLSVKTTTLSDKKEVIYSLMELIRG
ncbi:MAG: hypothetical protein A2Y25_10180 [Candidatus Melainabacteria bacterium GWF2_37_15]|nr:MAG: hypothetical protein A2Y25_10180 [Candidatus Melainabacteria bacterium GWF2_37_15]